MAGRTVGDSLERYEGGRIGGTNVQSLDGLQALGLLSYDSAGFRNSRLMIARHA